MEWNGLGVRERERERERERKSVVTLNGKSSSMSSATCGNGVVCDGVGVFAIRLLLEELGIDALVDDDDDDDDRGGTGDAGTATNMAGCPARISEPHL
jgi:hypothetical protein